MRKCTSLLIVLAFVQHLSAQVIISGKVKDNRGRPLPAASVSVKNTYDGTISDSSGNYSFSTTEKGEQTLITTNVGYRTVEQTITIDNAPLNIDISLKEELSELKAVIVCCGRYETRRHGTQFTGCCHRWRRQRRHHQRRQNIAGRTAGGRAGGPFRARRRRI